MMYKLSRGVKWLIWCGIIFISVFALLFIASVVFQDELRTYPGGRPPETKYKPYDGQLRPNLEVFDRSGRVQEYRYEEHGIANDAVFETRYDQITVSIDSDVYDLNSEEIRFTITNNNTDNLFFVWLTPFLEKERVEDVWDWVGPIRSPGLWVQWQCVSSSIYQGTITLYTESEVNGYVYGRNYHVDGLQPNGDYRLVFYVGWEKFYVPFTYVESIDE